MNQVVDAVEGGLPGPVADHLARFVGAAEAALGPLLKSIVLFGSAAEGRLRPTSDVNLLIVLSGWDDAKLDALREPLRTAQAAARLSAMVLLAGEVEAAIEAFPAKFGDILRRRKVLFGPDPMAGRVVPRGAEIAHVRQVLLNLALRLRERYLSVSLREEQAARVLAEASGPLRASAASLLALEGKPAPSPKEALAALAREVPGEWEDVLRDVSLAREGAPLPPGAAPASLRRLVRLAQGLSERARTLA